MSSFIPSDWQKRELVLRGRMQISCSANGHCILYSAYHALRKERNLQLSFGAFAMKIYHTLKHWDPEFIRLEGDVPASADQVQHLAHRFIFHYMDHDNPIVDIAPFAIAKVFQCKIEILEAEAVALAEPPNGLETEVRKVIF